MSYPVTSRLIELSKWVYMLISHEHLCKVEDWQSHIMPKTKIVWNTRLMFPKPKREACVFEKYFVVHVYCNCKYM